MWQKFGSWQAIRETPIRTNWRSAIAPVELSRSQSAQHSKNTGENLAPNAANTDIEFLRQMPTEAALQWLDDLPGVGRENRDFGAAVLLSSKPVIPVDTHLHRVCGRLGIDRPESFRRKSARRFCCNLLPHDAFTLLYNFHIAMLRHGQKICVWKNPRCEKCALREMCHWYQENKT